MAGTDHTCEKRGDAGDEIAIPKVALDYFFIGTEGTKASDNPVVIMVDESTGENTPEW